jgi:enamine deaminase RidA (YjgF/YER057c/UK114 family)
VSKASPERCDDAVGLKAAGKSFDDVVRAGVFLTNMSDFAAMNSIYAKHFSQPFPARTTSRTQRYHSGPALRSTSSSRLEARHGG